MSKQTRIVLSGVVFAFLFLLLFSSGISSVKAEAISYQTLFGSWKLGYALGNGADHLNSVIESGVNIYYIFTDDEMSGLSIAPDGSTDRLAKRSYDVNNGKLYFPAGEPMDISIQDGVLHMSGDGTEMLLIRADLDFLKGCTWDYVALSDDTQPDLVQQTTSFLSSGGKISFIFNDNYVSIFTTENGNTTSKQTSYTIEYDNMIQMFGSTVEVLIAEDMMIITDGTTWQYYMKQ